MSSYAGQTSKAQAHHPRDSRLAVDLFHHRGVTPGFESARPWAVVSRAARRSREGFVLMAREDIECKSTIPGGRVGISDEEVDCKSTIPGWGAIVSGAEVDCRSAIPGVDSTLQRLDLGRQRK